LSVDGHPAEVVGVLPAKSFQVRFEEKQSALDPDQSFVFAGGKVLGGSLVSIAVGFLFGADVATK
jgi:tRNA U34 2-thiouridine synthase MnmA/TrmU